MTPHSFTVGIEALLSNMLHLVSGSIVAVVISTGPLVVNGSFNTDGAEHGAGPKSMYSPMTQIDPTNWTVMSGLVID